MAEREGFNEPIADVGASTSSTWRMYMEERRQWRRHQDKQEKGADQRLLDRLPDLRRQPEDRHRMGNV